MNTHRNVVFNAQAYRDWSSLDAGRRGARSRAPVPHHRPDRAPGRGHVGPDASRPRLPLRSAVDARSHRAAPSDVHDRIDHGVHRADELPVSAWSRSLFADQGAERRRSDRAGDPRGMRDGVRLVHPQRLRPDGDDIPVAHGPHGQKGARRLRSRALSVGVPIPTRPCESSTTTDASSRRGGRGDRDQRPQVVPGTGRSRKRRRRAFRDGALLTGDMGFMDAEGGSTSSIGRRIRSTRPATRSGRARSRTSSTSIRRYGRPLSSAFRIAIAARP